MAKGRKFNGKNTGSETSSDAGATPARFTGSYQFVSPYLDEYDREWLDANTDQQEEMVFRLVFELDPAFKFSVSFDAKSERYLATLARHDVGHADSGKILSSRAATALDAAFKLAYLHLIKFEAGWGGGNAAIAGRWD